MKTWLIFDTHYLCHRAFHTTRDLSWKHRPTGVIYGFLKSVEHFQSEFQTDNLAFCFEHPHLFRKDAYRPYKARRQGPDRTQDEIKALGELAVQIKELRTRHLPRIGFQNIFCCRGMESDDLMAAIAFGLPANEDAILITADHDMYQCLLPNVSIYSPQAKKMITLRHFKRDFGIRPRLWAKVKSIAGCHSDCVEGIRGVGEKTALKYVRGELDKNSKAFKLIRDNKEIMLRNRKLVELPYEGCPMPRLVEEQINERARQKVYAELGMFSLSKKRL